MAIFNAVTPKSAETRPPQLDKKLKAPQDIEGGANRHCTDVLFMLLLVMSWVTMTAIGSEGISQGDPSVLVNGMDYNGRICGVDDAVADKPKMYYIRFDGTGVCVESCPTTTDWHTLWGCTDDYSATHSADGGSTFDCDGSASNQATCLQLSGLSSTGSGSSSSSSSAFEGSGDGECMYQIKSTDFINRCVFTDTDILSNFMTVGGSDMGYLREFASDVYVARAWIMGFGFCFSMLLGFLYIFMLRMPCMVCLMVWGSISAVFLLFVAMGYGFLQLATTWESDGEHTTTQANGCRALGYISLVCGFLFFCLVLSLRKQITLASGIVKESARAIGRVPLMVLMPFLQCVAIVAFLVPWVIYSVYTASIAEVSTTTVAGLTVRSFTYDQETETRGWFLLFVFFWTSQFIVAMGQIVIALTIVKYYFSRDVQSVNSGSFLKSLGEGLRYHTGTAAFGSLVIAIIQMIRAVMAYIQHKLSKSGNKLAEAMLCCMSCCFWCLEKCMKFINKNAYIQVAIFSTGFCRSAKNSFWLIARNLARIGAVSVVNEFVVFIMKLVICLGTAGACYLALEANISAELYSPVGPVIFVGIMSYVIASTFSSLLGMTTLTILQCFIADEEMFEGPDQYARNELRQWLDRHSPTSQTPGKGGWFFASKNSPKAGNSPKGKRQGEGKSEEEEGEGHSAVTGT